MNNYDRSFFDLGWIFFAGFALFTLAVFAIDVKAIGPEGTTIGLAALNGLIHNLTGVHETLDKVCDLLIVISLIPGVIGVYFGVKQLREGRKALQVDKAILALGAMYVILVIIYVAFEQFPVNYRPVILGDETMPEASFPSSHTLLVCTIMGCVYVFAKTRLANLPVGNLIAIVAIAIFAVAIILRLISGVHWFSDIIAAGLLSCSLACFYAAVIDEG